MGLTVMVNGKLSEGQSQILALSALAMLLASCTQGLAREGVERNFGRLLGQKPEAVFFGVSNVECTKRIDGSTAECTQSYPASGCAVKFEIERQTGVISGWAYVSLPEKCWKFSGRS